ncbi:MAG: nucleoside deaminase, partial [Ignavibacteria bacterium]|nr:nucleoside deaminase [Ignavibacteria bacterium]
MTQHEIYMNYAFKEAEKAFDKNEIPVGCIIVFQNMIVAKAHNLVESL